MYIHDQTILLLRYFKDLYIHVHFNTAETAMIKMSFPLLFIRFEIHDIDITYSALLVFAIDFPFIMGSVLSIMKFCTRKMAINIRK